MYSYPDPGFYPSLIPDLTTDTKVQGKNFVVVIYFFVAKFLKTENYFIFEVTEKDLSLLTKIYTVVISIKKFVPRSEIQKKPFPDPGLSRRSQKGTC
jgi:hypothetical protein